MAAFNVVRIRAKPGMEDEVVRRHREMQRDFAGFKRAVMVKTGDRTFCVIGEWESFQHIVDARPKMIHFLDETRDLLEDLGGDLGVTDPVSGEAVVDISM